MGRTGNPGVLQSVGSQRVKQTERLNNSKWDTERQCGTFSSSHICYFVVKKLIFRKIFKLQDFSIFDMMMLLFINMTMSKCLFYQTCSFIKNILSWIFFFFPKYLFRLRLPRWLRGKRIQPANAGDRRCRFSPWVRKIPWKTIPVFLPGESHGQSNLVGYSSSQHCKESDTDSVCVTEHTHIHSSDHCSV